MKKIITILSIVTFTLGLLHPTATTAKAATDLPIEKETVLLENGDYLETVIVDSPTLSTGISTFSTSKTITKTKTTRYKNQSGDILWSVSIKATFSYNGSTSRCTSCSHSTTCPAKTWKIKSVSSSRSGNSATAKAVATHSDVISRDFTKYVTISCNKNGVVS